MLRIVMCTMSAVMTGGCCYTTINTSFVNLRVKFLEGGLSDRCLDTQLQMVRGNTFCRLVKLKYLLVLMSKHCSIGGGN